MGGRLMNKEKPRKKRKTRAMAEKTSFLSWIIA